MRSTRLRELLDGSSDVDALLTRITLTNAEKTNPVKSDLCTNNVKLDGLTIQVIEATTCWKPIN